MSAQQPNRQLLQYTACFEPQEVMRRHAAPDLAARPGYVTNFLGVLIDPVFFPRFLHGRAGQVEDIPIPANWHADVAEWGAVLRAVDLARNQFTVVELGCGWGCWMNNSGVAARRAGLNVHLVGVEGDPGHVDFAHQATATNGFKPDQVTVHRGRRHRHRYHGVFAPNHPLRPAVMALAERECREAARCRDGRACERRPRHGRLW